MKTKNLKKAITQLIKGIKQFENDVSKIRGILEEDEIENDFPHIPPKVKKKVCYKIVNKLQDEIDKEEEEYFNMHPDEQAIKDLKEENENLKKPGKRKNRKKELKIELSSHWYPDENKCYSIPEAGSYIKGANEMAKAVHKWLGEMEDVFNIDNYFDNDEPDIQKTFLKHLKDGKIKPE